MKIACKEDGNEYIKGWLGDYFLSAITLSQDEFIEFREIELDGESIKLLSDDIVIYVGDNEYTFRISSNSVDGVVAELFVGEPTSDYCTGLYNYKVRVPVRDYIMVEEVDEFMERAMPLILYRELRKVENDRVINSNLE